MNPLIIKFAVGTALSIALFSSGWLVHGWKFDSEMRAIEQATNAEYHAEIGRAHV